MQTMLILLGALVLALVFVDVLRVTMGEGSGLLTRRVARWMWRAFLYLHRRNKRLHFLSAAGTVILLLNVILWVVLLWTGWVLVFSGAERAVVHVRTQGAAGFWERVYFTGFTIFTLGTGDYVPNGPFWQVLTDVASASGLFLVTLSISYLIPVIQAFTQKRRLAVQVASLGQTPVEILLNTYDGTSWQPLGEYLVGLTNELAKLEQRHLSYPMLHYFHSRNPVESSALRVTALDEALTIVEYGMSEPVRELAHGYYQPSRRMIANFLDTLEEVFIEPAAEAPPPPPLDVLRERGIPVVEEDVFQERVDALAGRRRLLYALVENDGWAWDELQ